MLHIIEVLLRTVRSSALTVRHATQSLFALFDHVPARRLSRARLRHYLRQGGQASSFPTAHPPQSCPTPKYKNRIPPDFPRYHTTGNQFSLRVDVSTPSFPLDLPRISPNVFARRLPPTCWLHAPRHPTTLLPGELQWPPT